MEIAEEEIENGKKKYPKMAHYIDKAFYALCPPEGFSNYDICLYRAYVIQQIDRIGTENKLEFATKAEVLIALSNMTLKSPLRPDSTLLYFDLFTELFPDRTKTLAPNLDDENPRESHKGATMELYKMIVKSLGVINRDIRPKISQIDMEL